MPTLIEETENWKVYKVRPANKWWLKSDITVRVPKQIDLALQVQYDYDPRGNTTVATWMGINRLIDADTGVKLADVTGVHLNNVFPDGKNGWNRNLKIEDGGGNPITAESFPTGAEPATWISPTPEPPVIEPIPKPPDLPPIPIIEPELILPKWEFAGFSEAGTRIWERIVDGQLERIAQNTQPDRNVRGFPVLPEQPAIMPELPMEEPIKTIPIPEGGFPEAQLSTTQHEIEIFFRNPFGMGEKLAVKAAENMIRINNLLPANFTYTHYILNTGAGGEGNSVTLYISEEGNAFIQIGVILAIVAVFVVIASIFIIGWQYRENQILQKSIEVQQEGLTEIEKITGDSTLSDEQKTAEVRKILLSTPDVSIPEGDDGFIGETKDLIKWVVVGSVAIAALGMLKK